MDDSKNKIWAIYSRMPDGTEAIISEKIEGQWVPLCSQDFGFIESQLATAKGLCEKFGREAILKTFVMESEKVL